MKTKIIYGILAITMFSCLATAIAVNEITTSAGDLQLNSTTKHITGMPGTDLDVPLIKQGAITLNTTIDKRITLNVNITNKLPLAGGTLTGNLIDTTTGNYVDFPIVKQGAKTLNTTVIQLACSLSGCRIIGSIQAATVNGTTQVNTPTIASSGDISLKPTGSTATAVKTKFETYNSRTYFLDPDGSNYVDFKVFNESTSSALTANLAGFNSAGSIDRMSLNGFTKLYPYVTAVTDLGDSSHIWNRSYISKGFFGGDAVPTPSSNLDARGNTATTYAVSIEQDHVDGYGVLIKSDANAANEPVLHLIGSGSTDIFDVAASGAVTALDLASASGTDYVCSSTTGLLSNADSCTVIDVLDTDYKGSDVKSDEFMIMDAVELKYDSNHPVKSNQTYNYLYKIAFMNGQKTILGNVKVPRGLGQNEVLSYLTDMVEEFNGKHPPEVSYNTSLVGMKFKLNATEYRKTIKEKVKERSDKLSNGWIKQLEQTEDTIITEDTDTVMQTTTTTTTTLWDIWSIL